MRSTMLHRAATAVLLLALLCVPAPARAGTETLKRGLGNLIEWPIDIVICPITAGMATYRNLRDIDDSKAVRYAYAAPGYVWMMMLFAGTSALRGVAGVLETVPGIGLAFTDSEMEPIFAPVERSQALIDHDTEFIYWRIGVDYSQVGY